VVVLATTWATCAALGAQVVLGVPVASAGSSELVLGRLAHAHAGLRDQQSFAAEAERDALRDTSGAELLTGLRGKDVVFAFVESYGRTALEGPGFASQVGAVLDDGNRTLVEAGFSSRSAFLTSSTAGGGSWLAHSTLQSGLWIDNQQRYRNLVAGHRRTLTGAFARAGWRTVGVMPGTTSAWPEGRFFGYHRVYDSADLDYRGPPFNWAGMPDQFTLAAFERLERAPSRREPVMAEIQLVSSHAPWEPLPTMVDWRGIGDGSVFDGMAPSSQEPVVILTRDPARVRADYRRSIEYSLECLISYVQTYGDDDLVLVFLGDHQPSPVVTGAGSGRDVPVTLVTRDRTVLERASTWGWEEGLKPSRAAPVWRMDAFRDRFLTAFGP
jgi:sulfatase-like protein